ncbi:MAG: hypothetical protein UT08_C0002G0060 [Candidatus Woesebacteria bacterium GW2011_GWB1_38_8]|uniref:Putative pre-16S rRNA nuclease n=1 Tax=Candidatus Woesebacteria bacterium GW2011_GWB1_38_8 TaxID=1618570 RepID=A0A0G0L235_9BACT|nr:MAG: hypothetical protein UT08_C0002G0060 [Candidatus Woesebacteria bacterium GW2011_GWB1_38_8]
MQILGIDYGRRKIGLALADGPLAEPYKVIRFKNEEEAIRRVEQVVRLERVEHVVIGISEGKMSRETREFGNKLQDELTIPVEYQDETLTTYEAQDLSIKAGINRKKRKALEDAYSAALILQNYLDQM